MAQIGIREIRSNSCNSWTLVAATCGLPCAPAADRIAVTMHDLIERLEGLSAHRIALLGDFMLDRYVYGSVERINPEAPVPVLRTVRNEVRVGGTGNVAVAAAALDADVRCIGVIGADRRQTPSRTR